MTALVTGGAGFIGSNLVDLLVSEGHEVRGRDVVIFGDGEQTRDFVNVADVARANYLAGMSDSAAGAFNIGSATRISINELASTMAEAAGVETSVVYGPPRLGDVRDSLAAIDAANAAFGFTPTEPLEGGLRAYLSWLRDDGVTRDRWASEE